MSLTATAASIAVATSAAALWRLAQRDPKRLRSVAAQATSAHSRRVRQGLALAALLPGVALMGLGYWPAFLIWLGASTVGGWLLAQAFAVRAQGVDS